MSPPEIKQLTKAEDLFNTGKIDEAYKLLRDFEKTEGGSLHDKVLSQLLRTELLFQQGKFREVQLLAKKTYEESLGLGKNLFSIDSLAWMAFALVHLEKFDNANDIIEQGEELLKSQLQEVTTGYKQRKAFLAYVKSFLYRNKRDTNQALEQGEIALELREELGNKNDIALSLASLAFWWSMYKGDVSRGLRYAERSCALVKDSNKKFCIAYSLFRLATVNSLQGEIVRSTNLFEQSLAIYKELDNKKMIANNLNNLGDKYRMQGDLDRGLMCLEQSVALHQEMGNLKALAIVHDFLIQFLIDKGDLERAKIYLYDLEQLNSELKDKEINFFYLFNKALLLKTSPRARNRIEAENIFNLLLEDSDLDYEITIRTLFNLCELHLIELRMINDIELIDEINPLIVRLLNLAEEANSYWILSETYLLQAKLSLLTFDIKKAQRLLTQAQKMAESYGLKSLAMKISYEHDKLIKQINIWEDLKDSEATLSERWKLAGLQEQMETILRKRTIEVPELSDEESIFLLIVSEGGVPFFSHSFLEDKAFEDHLFGGFFTAINSFINEKFSERLDRASFGKYTLLMNSVSPFLMCYIYKGQSYTAQKRLKVFINELKRNNDMWNSFAKFDQANRKLEISDIPSLEPLIKEIFIEKRLKY